MKRILLVFAWLTLLAAAALAHLVSQGTLNPAVTPDLDQLPAQLGSIEMAEIYDIDPVSLGDLPPTEFRFQQIFTESGVEGRMYLAYFERGKRWSGFPHPVDICYRALGWDDLSFRRLQTSSGARLSLHDFDREGEQIRVLHWQQRPSLVPGTESAGALLGRVRTPDRLRQDVASVYFEFPLEGAPSDEQFVEAAEVLIAALEILWALT